MGPAASILSRAPWNKGKIVGQKAPSEVKDAPSWSRRSGTLAAMKQWVEATSDG